MIVAGGSLRSIVAEFGPLQEDAMKVYTRQILLGLQYLHHQDILHGDIKGKALLHIHSHRQLPHVPVPRQSSDREIQMQIVYACSTLFAC